jgi:hypothetical protein
LFLFEVRLLGVFFLNEVRLSSDLRLSKSAARLATDLRLSGRFSEDGRLSALA